MKRSKNFSNSERLVDITSKYMSEKQLLDLDEGYSGESHFKKITEKYFDGLTNEKAIQNLYVKWNRNDGNFRDRVLKQLNGKYSKSDQFDQTFYIDLNSKEWFDLFRFKSIGERPKLLASANQILCKKIQNVGIKCGFKLKSNAFSNAKREIPGHNFWRGVLKCIKCGNEIVGKIEREPRKEENMLIKFEWNGLACSFIAPMPKKQIRGEERILIMQEIAAKGLTNFKTEAFISGSLLQLY